jgi:acyl-CoA oxidase
MYYRITYFTGGYCTGPEMADLVKENILLLCAELKPEAIAIADALAPPDFVLNSVLGMSDGKVRLFLSTKTVKTHISSE